MMNFSQSTLRFQVDWRVKTEPVYRLLDNIEYVDAFFEKGEILVSCLKKFKIYPDEVQGDIREGIGSIAGEDKEGNTKMIIYDSGINAYVLSTTKEINSKIIKAFKAKCAIKIHHPTLFALELSRKMSYVCSGLEGSCEYGSSKVQVLEKETTGNEVFQKMAVENSVECHRVLTELTNGLELFFKPDKYSYQREYRFIWFSNKHIHDSLIVNCPEAREYCEKVIF